MKRKKSDKPIAKDDYLLDLQLAMATSSINHEYARMEFEEIGCPQQKEELLNYMSDCRDEYFRAREELKKINPLILEQFEDELASQKQATLTHYNA